MAKLLKLICQCLPKVSRIELPLYKYGWTVFYQLHTRVGVAENVGLLEIKPHKVMKPHPGVKHS